MSAFTPARTVFRYNSYMLATRLALVVALSAAAPALAQTPGVVGDWREPGGSVIRIATCGQDICAQLVHLPPDAPSHLDGHNPDPAKRSESLCGLRIGYGFHLTNPNHASGGQLYDPKSGHTYHGEMTATGDRLDLRGYIGIRAFGRSEQWTRYTGPAPTCP